MRKIAALALIVGSIALPGTAAAEVPVYGATYAGPGISSTMNDLGVVIGNDSPIYPGQPWVNDGNGPRPLPLPPGTTAARAGDINNAGQIVGTGYTDGQLTSDVPALWTPNGTGGYDVELLPIPDGGTRGTGVSINNVGEILASGFLIGGVLPTYQAYVIDEHGVATALGISGGSTINDNGLVLGSTIFDSRSMTDLGVPPLPDGMNAVAMYLADLNNNNEVLVTMLQTIISHTRYEVVGIYDLVDGQWTTLTGVGFNFSGVSMNDGGDFLVTGGSCSVMVYLQGEGYYCPDSLLDPGQTEWTLRSTIHVANDRSLLAQGTNAATGQSGTALLTVQGALPAPAAPLNVVATPHEPTAQQNFISIDLSWEAADTLTRSFVVERRGPTDADFVELASTSNLFYRDMSIVGGETYQYRVVAVGLSGNSVPSAVVSAVAPQQADVESPVIVSISPQAGDAVTGVVTITVTASDNVGVHMITVDAPGMKRRCDTFDSSTATCRWDTRGLDAGPATIYVTAADAMGNGDFELVTVTVEPSEGKGGGKGGGKGPKK